MGPHDDSLRLVVLVRQAHQVCHQNSNADERLNSTPVLRNSLMRSKYNRQFGVMQNSSVLFDKAQGQLNWQTWFSVARAPLMEMGATSEMYRGTYSEAAPAPTPAKARPAWQGTGAWLSIISKVANARGLAGW